MTIDPVALMKRFHAALEPYDAEAVTQMFSEDSVYVSPGVGGRIAGRAAIIAAFTAYFTERPDQHAETESVEQVNPLAARARWRLEATRRSTGERITRRGTETVSFDAAGLIRHVEVEDE